MEEGFPTRSRESSFDTTSERGLSVIFAPVLPSVERKSSVLPREVLAPSIQSSIESTFRVWNQSNSSSSLTLCPLNGVSTATWAVGFSGGLKNQYELVFINRPLFPELAHNRSSLRVFLQ